MPKIELKRVRQGEELRQALDAAHTYSDIPPKNADPETKARVDAFFQLAHEIGDTSNRFAAEDRQQADQQLSELLQKLDNFALRVYGAIMHRPVSEEGAAPVPILVLAVDETEAESISADVHM